jgi:hypothetical protein
MSDLAQALMVAIRVHAGQTDKRGEPYLLHVLRVVEAVSDEAKVLASLHDVLEDDPKLLPYDVSFACELSHDEFGALLALSRSYYGARPIEPYAAYIEAVIGGGPLAIEVKVADLRDNLGRIPPRLTPRLHGIARSWDQEWAPLKRRYEKALQVLEGASKQ